METTTNTSQDSTDQADPTADHATNHTATGQTAEQAMGPQGPAYAPAPALVRPFRGRMLTGVAAGVADYFGVDPTLVRIALAVLAVAGPGIPLYLAGWLLIPDEGARQSVAADVIDSFSAR
ncbi:MAG TPA: PspC domain-containing protein [Streptosporangiaceae bacterium]|jgi:phage shock protein PspC (stress-responsive transcriptional regulator)